MKSFVRSALLVSVAAMPATIVPLGCAAYAQTATRSYSIASQDLGDALRQFATQSGRDVVFDPAIAQGKTSKAVRGTMSDDAALRQLMEGSNLTFASTSSGFAIRSAVGNGVAGADSASSQGDGASTPALDEVNRGVSEILVVGSRTRNVDIRRTRDDVQPYVVFDYKQIIDSGATNLESFLSSRLPSNAAQDPSAVQVLSSTAALHTGTINLRGLGTNQTLILVDGRRVTPSVLSGTFAQPALRDIPMAAIERVEILPTSASGAYGGGATGGVVNVILKHDYSGLDLDVNYGNSFKGDVHTAQISLTAGKSFEGGRTRVMLRATRFTAGTILLRDRPMSGLSNELNLRADPTLLPFSGPNICSTTAFFSFNASCDGAPLTLDNGTALNSGRTFVPRGYAGPASDNGAALTRGAGRSDNSYDPDLLWTMPDAWSTSIDLRREFSSHFEAYLSFSRSEQRSVHKIGTYASILVPGSDASNPFQQNVIVKVPLPNVRLTQRVKGTNQNLLGGFILRLPNHWALTGEYNLGRLKSASSAEQLFGTAFGADSLLAPFAFADTRDFPVSVPQSSLIQTFSSDQDFKTKSRIASARASGPLFKVPGGNVTATLLAEHQFTDVPGSVQASSFFGFNSFFWIPPADRSVSSGYMEVRVPMLSAANGVRFARELELVGSIRHDHYKSLFRQLVFITSPEDIPSTLPSAVTSKFNSTDFTVGVKYSPVTDVSFRASYATGFLPPQLSATAPGFSFTNSAANYFVNGETDPRRGNTSPNVGQNIAFTSDLNGDLVPEQSRSFSYGAILTPSALRGFRLSIDVTQIKKSSEITSLAGQEILNNEPFLPGRVTRGPNLPGDDPTWAGPIVGLDTSAINLARSKVRAIDMQADYQRSTHWGDIRLYISATRQNVFNKQVAPASPVLSYVNDRFGALAWRGNGGFDWEQGPWSAGWNTQYFGKANVCTASSNAAQCMMSIERQGSATIGDQFYHDVRIGFDFSKASGSLAHSIGDAQLTLSIQNIFDKIPPIYAEIFDYSPYGADPRLRRFTLAIHKHF